MRGGSPPPPPAPRRSHLGGGTPASLRTSATTQLRSGSHARRTNVSYAPEYASISSNSSSRYDEDDNDDELSQLHSMG